MNVVGWLATGVVAVVVVGGAAVALGSLPDIKRYLRIRNM
jgi:hypothetical protein